MTTARTALVAALTMTLAAAGVLADVRPARSVPPACRQATDPEATSILVVGDSVAQGSSGDWTWRYRLWKHLTGSGARVDLVGPRDDLFDRQADRFGSQAYADPVFDRDHAARWGMAFAEQDHPIGDLVTPCRPDVVVEALGINDLVWQDSSPQTVVEEARTLVADARAADPTVDVVLSALPQTWFAGVSEYNAVLPALAAELSSDESRVVAADTGTGFVENVDTYDVAHLSATGEVKLAAGVADALGALGVGTPYPRPLPVVPNGPSRPAVLSAVAGDGRVRLAWTLPPGAESVVVWLRDATAGEPWTRLPYAVPWPTTTWTATGLTNYHEYRFRLQAAKGTAVSETFSNTVPSRPRKPAPGPVSLTLTSGRHRLVARWTASRRATAYVVSWKRRGAEGGEHRRRTSSRYLRIDHLRSGGSYRVRVMPLNVRTVGPTATKYGRPR
ncbi:hypothetical protein EKO23_04285 [Nocardioides guangzhouensis]|uniref:Fibronectin type-III domain-containing protein n=1 Tax=Nocardioides guangzhouensis TaxID=2497878 RepID=A0A4Q4ZJE0_9ACTN|nr:GDSL-type esterase/lipase family protein [Nocardioides guangzhouensis]RYP88068.1 hypothetical protein EKO23_04285 [Nocardioides guangzhouensis]